MSSQPLDNVIDQPRVKQLIASAGQTQFDYPFAIFTADDLVVNVDGTDLDPSAYSLSGVGEDNGGTVTLNDALEGGEVVTVYGDARIERLTNYQFRGPFDTERFNLELDRMTVNMQELREGVGRSMRAAVTDQQRELVLPERDLRAGRFLAFDQDGKPIASTGSGEVTNAQLVEFSHPEAPAIIRDLRARGSDWMTIKDFGARGNARIQRVAYSPAAHSGGFTAQYPYMIHELQDGDDDSAAFAAAFGQLEDGMSLYLPAGVYFMTNADQFGTADEGEESEDETRDFSFAQLVRKKNITIYGDGVASKIFVFQDITQFSLRVIQLFGCEDIIIENIAIDYQAIGHPDAPNHPLADPDPVQTRATLIDAFPGPDDEPSRRVTVRNCALRLNHPEGAYPGESYMDGSTSFSGSGKLIGVNYFGTFVAADTNGDLPAAHTAIVTDSSVVDCTFFETQARTIWNWMTENSLVARNRFIRSGGLRPCSRNLHYNRGLTVVDNHIQAENDWKNGDLHEAPITVSFNGGNYINKEVRLERNVVYRQHGAGVSINGVRGALVGGNFVTVAPGFNYTSTNTNFNGINARVPPGYDPSSAPNGGIDESTFRDNTVVGGHIGHSYRLGRSNQVINAKSRGVNEFGVLLSSVDDLVVHGGVIEGSGSHGVFVAHSAAPLGGRVVIRDVLSKDNGGRGFNYTTGATNFQRIIYDTCASIDNTSDGYRYTSQAATLINCLSRGNSSDISDNIAVPRWSPFNVDGNILGPNWPDETGENANGRWVRWANGVQEVWIEGVFDTTTSSSQSYTLPRDFNAETFQAVSISLAFNNNTMHTAWRAADPVSIPGAGSLTLRGTGSGADNAVAFRAQIRGFWSNPVDVS
jgi:hypothetical protein